MMVPPVGARLRGGTREHPPVRRRQRAYRTPDPQHDAHAGGVEPIAIRHDAGSTYAGRLEQWQAYGNPVPLACMVADCVVREQDRIGKIVSDIRRGHPIAGHARGIRE